MVVVRAEEAAGEVATAEEASGAAKRGVRLVAATVGTAAGAGAAVAEEEEAVESVAAAGSGAAVGVFLAAEAEEKAQAVQ